MRETAVAIIDSHAVLRESLSAWLDTQLDIRVVGSAPSPSQAVDLVQSLRPDVVILDGDIDPASGAADVLREITGSGMGPAIVLLMSDEDREAAALAMRFGVYGFVLKMAPLQEVAEAVRWAAKEKMWISPPLLTSILSGFRPSSEHFGARDSLMALTKRELQVLTLMVDGLNHTAIADRLNVSTNTVRTHTQNLQKKLNVHSGLAAVSVALEAGLRPD
ncbi:MAG TPA: response regulator transcription factor [Acidimicrobiales bacterium]|nr:response regulator transcription factor [Acidimicrobiales bacterium]